MYERLLTLAKKEEKRKLILKENEKLRWGILGTGQIANKFIKDLVESKSQNHIVSAIASSSDLKKAIDLKGKFPKLEDACYCYSSYPELCADKNVDIVYVATPNSRHFRDSLLALNCGKHLLVEKSFTLSQKEADALILKAKEKGVFLMEAMWTRYIENLLKI